MTYPCRPVRRQHTDDVCLGIPPKANMLRRVRDGVNAAHDVVEIARLLNLLETESRFDFKGDLEDEAGGAKSADGGHEELWALCA